MFVVRDGQGGPLLRWKDAQKVEWGILLLFGGGLSLAAGMQASGWLDALEGLSGKAMPTWVWIFIFTAVGVWTTELFSNMALVSATLPIALAVARAQGLEFEQLALPLTIGASCAFMLPMATPPNAIVFSSGKVTVPYMAARGLAPVHTPGLGSERCTGTIHLCHSANAPGKKGLEIPAHAPQAAHLRLTRTQEYVPSDAP